MANKNRIRKNKKWIAAADSTKNLSKSESQKILHDCMILKHKRAHVLQLTAICPCFASDCNYPCGNTLKWQLSATKRRAKTRLADRDCGKGVISWYRDAGRGGREKGETRINNIKDSWLNFCWALLQSGESEHFIDTCTIRMMNVKNIWRLHCIERPLECALVTTNSLKMLMISL